MQLIGRNNIIVDNIKSVYGRSEYVYIEYSRWDGIMVVKQEENGI